MGKLVIHQDKITQENAETLIKLCPFNAIEYKDGKLDINAACKTCRMCVRKGPAGAITWEEEAEAKPKINKDEWKGIAVFMELMHEDGIHPVSFELIGKAKELAAVINHPVYAIFIGNHEQVEKYSDLPLRYGADKVFIYEHEEYGIFNVERASRCVEDFINKIKPTVVLYGGTPLGRSFAPRIAAHFKTGLTADCTRLGMKENTDLIQVRPAFGGNVMAQIICTNTRPQMATVRYKIFKMPELGESHGEKVFMDLKGIDLASTIKTLEIKPKEKVVDISEASVIIACGRPFKSEDDFKMAEELADLLGGVVAVSRPLVEAGIKDAKFQIGLSGKTVAPKLIICLGISGAVQFTAGMNGSETIIAINQDPNAAIFDVAHYGIVDDVFKVVPKLIEQIKQDRGAKNV